MMQALVVIYTIWLREFKTFLREKSRIIGMIGQPLLYLIVMGKGLGSAMSLNGAGGNAPAGLDYITFMFPGIVGMSVLFTSIFSAVSIIWDREFGFLKEVLVAPVPRWAVAVGKCLGGATVAVIQSVIIVALAPFVGVSLTFLVVVELLAFAFVISFAMTGFGVTIAARMDSMQGFQMIMNFLVMPLYFLSGSIFPIATAPGWMKSIMIVNPLSYGIDAIRNVLYSGTTVTMGPGFEVPLVTVAKAAGMVRWDLAQDLVVMLVVAVLLASVGAYSFATSDK
jgi:ABC-2 type transport system permease protein